MRRTASRADGDSLRHAIRYLPAFLVLLIPLGLLAFLGSRELSTQEDRAENFLRERAYDFLVSGVRQFDETIRNYTDVLIGADLDTDYPSLFAAARANRDLHPDVLELMVLQDDADLVHPRRGPRSTDSPPFSQISREVRVAQSLMHAGDTEGAIKRLEAYVTTDGNDDRARWFDSRSRTRARIQLAGLYRGSGQLEAALAMFTETLRGLNDPTNIAARTRGSRSSRSERRYRAIEFPTDALLCRAAAAELKTELSGDTADLVELLQDLAAGQFDNVTDGVLTAVLDRAAARAPADTGDLVTAARSGLAELAGSRLRARNYEDRVDRELRNVLRRAGEDDLIQHVFDDSGLATCLLILRRVRNSESALYAGSWVGFQLDLTALTNHALAQQLAPTDDGFHLDILTRKGTRVLRHEQPEGADDWESEVLARSTVAGLQFRAIPRNVRQQLEDQQASARTRMLLMLALGLIGLGGAFYLVRAVGRETELANMKVNLVSRVSHDLKTPLAMIKMYGETVSLGRTHNQAETQHFASIISREADRLTLWIDRILDFARRERGEMIYHMEPLDLTELVQRVAEEYHGHVESADMSLDTDLQDELPVEADPSAMESTLVNLLENALKYTPEQSPGRKVELATRRSGDRAIVEVLDRGVGIPEDEQAKVFDSFFRARTAGQVRGAGLGLSLVQHCVQAHAGTIEAKQRTGGGTIFRLSFPLLSPERNG